MSDTTSTKDSSIENKKEEGVRTITKYKKHIAILRVVVILLVLAFLAKSLLIAATVNGSPITRFSIIRELENQGGKQALQSLIEQKIIQAEIAKSGITVTKEEVSAELKKIEDRVKEQGGTLEEALASQGATIEKLEKRIEDQKKLEALLADKIKVSDEEVETYIKESQATPPENMSQEDFRKEIKDQLKSQKFQQEIESWMQEKIQSSKIKYFKKY